MDSATEQAGKLAARKPIKLKPRQAQMYYEIVRWCRDTGGASPSIRDLMRICDISSTSVVSYHLRYLVNAGLIYIAPGASRGIMVAGARWIPPILPAIEITNDPRMTIEETREYWARMQRVHRATKAAMAAAEVAA